MHISPATSSLVLKDNFWPHLVNHGVQVEILSNSTVGKLPILMANARHLYNGSNNTQESPFAK